MKGSKILDFIFGYESSEEKFRQSRVGTAGKNFSDTLIGGIGNAYAKKILRNPISRFFTSMNHKLAITPLRTYGIALLTFGLTTLLINFADYYFRALPTSPAPELIIGVVFAILALPLILINAPTAEFLQKNPVTDVIFFEIFCLHRVRQSGTDEGRSSVVLEWICPITVGIAIATLGFFLPLVAVLGVIAGIIFVMLAISSPEFSFMSTIFFLPLIPLFPAPSILLSALVGVTMISFLSKVLLGKRLFHFEQYDAIIILFMLFTLISGMFNKGFESFESSLILIILSSAYFLASNIIVNRRLADNAVNLIIASSVPTSIYGIITYFQNPILAEWIDISFKDNIRSRAVATFGNPNIFAVFLIISTLFSLGFAIDDGRKKSRIVYIFTFLLNGTALALTWTRGAWIAVILAVFAYIIILSRRAPKLLLLPALAIPALLYLIPESFITRLMSIFNLGDSSISYRLSIWRSSLRMFADRLFIGVGVGDSAFNEEFMKYAEEGVSSPHHSHNLFIEIGCELGIFALLLFAFLLISRVRHRATYARYVKSSSVKSLCTVSGAVLFALLAFGMTDYIWYNSSMCFLFWIVFGLGSATLRISKNEYDEMSLSQTGDSSMYSANSNIYISTNE